MEEYQEKVFKYKLDFYYLSALIYLLTLITYSGIRGSFVEKEFTYVMSDPILYVIIFFVVMSFSVLILNYIRNRRLIITPDGIIFKNRFHVRKIATKDIVWMHIGRERFVQTSGRFQVVMLKLNGRRRAIRIRIGRYEKERELVNEMQRIAGQVPKRKRPRWRQPPFTDR